VHPDTVSVWSGQGADGARTDAFGVQFAVDALVPCCVKLFWGVSVAACNEFGRQHSAPAPEATGRWSVSGNAEVRRQRRSRTSGPQESTRSLLEMEELNTSITAGHVGGEESPNFFLAGQYVAQSRDFFLPAGSGQRYATPVGDLVDQNQLQFDLSAPWLREGQTFDDTAVMPLAIVAIAQGRRPARELGDVQGSPVVEAHGEVSFVKFRQTSGPRGYGPGIPEVVRQVTFGDRAAHEIQGIFGFEEDEGDGECMICYSRPKNVLLLPCRHCSVCHPCLRSLRDEKCPLCRSVFSSYVTFPIPRAGAGSPSAADAAPPSDPAPPPPPPSGSDCGSNGGGGGGSSAGGGNGGAAPCTGTGTGTGTGTSSSDTANTQAPSTEGAEDSSLSTNTPAAAPGGNAVQPDDSKAETSTTQKSASLPRPAAATAAAAPASAPLAGTRTHTEPVARGSGTAIAPSLVQMETRQTTPREVAAARPRGTAPAPRTTAQGRWLSGRARFSERADTAETPLLQEGEASPARGLAEADDCRREQNSTTHEVSNEETHILIQNGDAV